MKCLDIYYRDLMPEAQAAVLELHHIKSPDEANWDSFPIVTLEGPELDVEKSDDA